jgi:hypothetical protein
LQAALHGLHGGYALTQLGNVLLGNVFDLGAAACLVAPQT